MKRTRSMLLTILLSAFLGPAIQAQGPLTPPGAPAPTMKSLDQIEARTPISTAPFNINASGSYYLTKNLVVATGSAIAISANNVTLDLNGFNISSTESPASTNVAIYASGTYRNITILNGSISSGVTLSGGTYSGTGFASGISLPNVATARVSGITVAGVKNHGIYVDVKSSVVENCTVDTAGGFGIYATSVFNSSALNTGTGGILGNNISNCFATSVGYGIYSSTVTNSYGASTGSSTPGIYAVTASNSWGAATADSGIRATNIDNCFGTTTGNSGGGGIFGDTVSNSRGDSSGSASGLRANISASNCYGNNTSTGIGLVAGAAQNCYGHAVSSDGLNVTLATGSWGKSNGSGYGIYAAFMATNSLGLSSSGDGVYTAVATGSYGSSTSANGINTSVATGSYGSSTSGNGINTSMANGCYGSGGKDGIFAIKCVNGSYGYTSATSGFFAGIYAQTPVFGDYVPVSFSYGESTTSVVAGMQAGLAFCCHSRIGPINAPHNYFCGTDAGTYYPP